MAKISIRPFSGLTPKISPQLLDGSQSTKAVNCRLSSGELRPWRGPLEAFSLSKPGPIKTIYRWAPTPGNENSGFWFHWPEVVSVADGPISNDTQARVYFTGDGVPKMTYAGIATAGGSTNYPTNAYNLGIPAPDTSPVPAIQGSPSSGVDPEEDKITRGYVVTYVSALGEEGPPCNMSVTVDWLPGQTVELSSIPTAPTGALNITHKKLYRSATGASGTDLYFVALLPVSQDSYNDIIGDDQLGSVLESTDYYSPPEDLHSIQTLPAGFCFGFSKNNVCASEAYLPHAWNPDNQVPLPQQIVGGGYFDNNIVACTEKNPYIISGTDPRALLQNEIKLDQGCVSRRSIVSFRYGVAFASPDGLFLIGGDGARSLTEPYLSIDQWRALNPSSIIGAVFEDKYFGFYDNGTEQGAFILDPKNPEQGLTFTTVSATGAYADPLTDKLYLIVGDNIHAWNEGEALTYTWRSKEFLSPRSDFFTCARVEITSPGSLVFRLYIDGQLAHEQAVLSYEPFRLPPQRGQRYQVELEGTAHVSKLDVASTMSELTIT